jgi:hypothetical protein
VSMVMYTDILSTGSARSRCDISSMETFDAAPSRVPLALADVQPSSRRRNPPANAAGCQSDSK